MPSVRLYCDYYYNHLFEATGWLFNSKNKVLTDTGYFQNYDFDIRINGNKTELKWLLDNHSFLESFSLYTDAWELINIRIMNLKVHRQSVTVKNNIISFDLTIKWREFFQSTNKIKGDWKLIGF